MCFLWTITVLLCVVSVSSHFCDVPSSGYELMPLCTDATVNGSYIFIHTDYVPRFEAVECHCDITLDGVRMAEAAYEFYMTDQTDNSCNITFDIGNPNRKYTCRDTSTPDTLLHSAFYVDFYKLTQTINPGACLSINLDKTFSDSRGTMNITCRAYEQITNPNNFTTTQRPVTTTTTTSSTTASTSSTIESTTSSTTESTTSSTTESTTSSTTESTTSSTTESTTSSTTESTTSSTTESTTSSTTESTTSSTTESTTSSSTTVPTTQSTDAMTTPDDSNTDSAASTESSTPSTSSTTTTTQAPVAAASVGPIVGGVVAALVVVFIILIVIFCCIIRRRRNRKKPAKDHELAQIDGDPFNPTDDAIMISNVMYNMEVSQNQDKPNAQSSRNPSVTSVPYATVDKASQNGRAKRPESNSGPDPDDFDAWFPISGGQPPSSPKAKNDATEEIRPYSNAAFVPDSETEMTDPYIRPISEAQYANADPAIEDKDDGYAYIASPTYDTPRTINDGYEVPRPSTSTSPPSSPPASPNSDAYQDIALTPKDDDGDYAFIK